MKIIYSEDKQTIKYLHEDGSETSLKMELSGKFDKNLTLHKTNNNKYSLVLSCSSGCKMSCSFCHLTQLKKNYNKLTTPQVAQNIKNVLNHALLNHPELSTRNIKLCWMGEGEPLLNTTLIKEVSVEVLEYALSKKYCVGLDGVDISTSFPSDNKKWKQEILILKNFTDIYKTRQNKSSVRLFYSLHSTIDVVREKLIPRTENPKIVLGKLHDFCRENNIDLVNHVTFIEGVNDTQVYVDHLIQTLKNKCNKSELRVLRYNPFNSTTQESLNLKNIIKQLENSLPNVKIQYSSGTSIKSACGMFN